MTPVCETYSALDQQRVALRAKEQQLANDFYAALKTNSPNADTIDTQHQAVLRQLSDIQQRILVPESGPPPAANTCATLAPSSSSSTAP